MKVLEDISEAYRLYTALKPLREKPKQATLEGKTLMELFTCHELLLRVLPACPKARDSDEYLYKLMTVVCDHLGIPQFSRNDTIRRTRQKLQAEKNADGSWKYPDCQPSPEIKKARQRKAKVYGDFFGKGIDLDFVLRL